MTQPKVNPEWAGYESRPSKGKELKDRRKNVRENLSTVVPPMLDEAKAARNTLIAAAGAFVKAAEEWDAVSSAWTDDVVHVMNSLTARDIPQNPFQKSIAPVRYALAKATELDTTPAPWPLLGVEPTGTRVRVPGTVSMHKDQVIHRSEKAQREIYAVQGGDDD